MSKSKVEDKIELDFTKAIQDYYPDDFAYCFGCGRNNEYGLHTKTYWDDVEEMGVCRFTPKKHHCGHKSVLHGGLISSLIECNTEATSIAATYKEENLDPDKDLVVFVFGSINARFSKPVPLKAEVVVKTKVIKLEKKKATCSVSVYANDILCSTAETIAIRVPDKIINAFFNTKRAKRE